LFLFLTGRVKFVNFKIEDMAQKRFLNKYHNLTLPLFIEKDEDDFYIVECPILEGCYTQGKTIDEALKNIREVIELILKEKKSQEILKDYQPKELSLHTITL